MSFPTTVADNYDWSYYNPQDFIEKYFDQNLPLKISSNFQIFFGGPGDEEDFEDLRQSFEAVLFKDRTKDDIYDRDFDTKRIDISLFVSRDGAWLLKKYDELVYPADDHLYLFLEVKDDDTFSETILLSKGGRDVIKYADDKALYNWVNGKYNLSRIELTDLIKATQSSETFLDKLLDIFYKILNEIEDVAIEIGVDVLDSIIQFFAETLHIDEKTWNPDDPNYALKVLEDIRAVIKEGSNDIQEFLDKNDLPDWIENIITWVKGIIDAIAEALETFIDDIVPFLCGAWNGLIDMISGVFELIKLVFVSMKSFSDYQQKPSYYNALAVEYVDNVIHYLRKISFIDLFKIAAQFYVELVKLIIFLPATIRISESKLAYYSGYVAANFFGLCFPPAGLASLSRSESIVVLFQKVLVESGVILNNGVAGGVNTVKQLFVYLEAAVEILRGGTRSIRAFLSEIIEAIKLWLAKLLGRVVSISDFDEEDLELFRALSKGAKDSMGGRLLTTKEIKSLHRYLFKKYQIRVKLVDKEPSLKNKLRDWNQRGVVGAFNPLKKILYLQSKVSELTIFHEMCHIKIWNELNPEDYLKLTIWEDETYVWQQIWKTRQRWTKSELMDSYRYVNSIREGAGINKITIDEMEEMIKLNKFNLIK